MNTTELHTLADWDRFLCDSIPEDMLSDEARDMLDEFLDKARRRGAISEEVWAALAAEWAS